MTENQRLASLRNAFVEVQSTRPGFDGLISINHETGEPEFREYDYATMDRETYEILRKAHPRSSNVMRKTVGYFQAKLAEMRRL